MTDLADYNLRAQPDGRTEYVYDHDHPHLFERHDPIGFTAEYLRHLPAEPDAKPRALPRRALWQFSYNYQQDFAETESNGRWRKRPTSHAYIGRLCLYPDTNPRPDIVEYKHDAETNRVTMQVAFDHLKSYEVFCELRAHEAVYKSHLVRILPSPPEA